MDEIDAIAARKERLLQVLQELTEIGMEMARALKAEAQARVDAEPAVTSAFAKADLGLVFSRIAKAVR